MWCGETKRYVFIIRCKLLTYYISPELVTMKNYYTLIDVSLLLIITFIGSTYCCHSIDAVALPSNIQNFNDIVLLDETSYTFEKFLSDFGRSYFDPIEYMERKQIFYDNLHTIVSHNQKRDTMEKTTDSSTAIVGRYWMGINPYTDCRANELHRGYDKYQSTKRRLSLSSSSVHMEQHQQQQQLRSHGSKLMLDDHTKAFSIDKKLGIVYDPVEDLPTFIDWRMKGVTTPVKSQGDCGSCWAFASTAILESHIALQTGYLYDLSPQELVSCALNPSNCSGQSGCDGSTAEIAFQLVQQYGIVQEWQFGYQDSTGLPINCSLSQKDKPNNGTGKTYFREAVAGITDYFVLPSNNYTVLMNVVAKLGPVAVSVACMPWHLYQSGVFYEPMSNDANRTSTTDVDHLVALEGYGTDEETGEEYWIVRNSWGVQWGEHGYIRLKRVGEKECAYDTTPDDGSPCAVDPDGYEIIPEPQKICGNSGILSDSTIPVGGYLV
jgi:cathepsin L